MSKKEEECIRIRYHQREDFNEEIENTKSNKYNSGVEKYYNWNEKFTLDLC